MSVLHAASHARSGLPCLPRRPAAQPRLAPCSCRAERPTLEGGPSAKEVKGSLTEAGVPVEELVQRSRAWLRDFKLEEFEQQGGYLVVAQLALLLAVLAAPGEGVIEQAGVLSMLTGGVTAGLGVVQIGANNFTALPSPSRDSTLTTSGIYGFVRHPMYAGLLLFAFGFAAATNSVTRAIFAALLFGVLNAKVEKEEEELGALHPGYADYKKRVKRLVPYLF